MFMFLFLQSLHILYTVSAVKYPNEIAETPVVLCEPERMVIKIKTTSSNPSHIYAEEFADDPDCSSRNMNKVSIPIGRCGMTAEKTENPAGTINRVCIAVQLHPLFVTEADRSYCAQCVYVENHVLDDFEQSLAISEHQPTELEPQFDFQDTPRCTYTIRKGSKDGPQAHYASVGESVFHVWHCDSATAGILVQNCYVEDGQGNRILILDHNGCGVDHYVMATPNYTDELTTAYQETHVFKFAQKTITRFTCQIRICFRGRDCKDLSPPQSCPSLEERIEQAKQFKDQPQPPTKNIFTSFDAVKAATKQMPRPPALSPKNFTIQGKILPGDLHRKRRETAERVQELVVKTEKGYPELDVVGELRVLDNPDDVKYYEERINAPLLAPSCSSSLTFSLLVSALVVLAILLITLILLITTKHNEYKNKTIRVKFPQLENKKSTETAILATDRSSRDDVISFCDHVGNNSTAEGRSHATSARGGSLMSSARTARSIGPSLNSSVVNGHQYCTGQDVAKSSEEPLYGHKEIHQKPGGLTLKPTVTVFEFPNLGKNIQHPKRGDRGTNNPWRKYGALKKLHEIGGYVTLGDRKKKEYAFTAPGTPLPPQPQAAELTINKDKQAPPNFLSNIPIPRGIPAEELAHRVALHIEAAVNQMGDFTDESSESEEDADPTEEMVNKAGQVPQCEKSTKPTVKK